jgi:hypothetical protein
MRATEFINETQLVWKRNSKTGRVVLKWRCTTGPRKNRTVTKAQDCSSAPDLAQQQKFKQTRAKTKVRQARRAKKTKRINPASRLATRLNKLNKNNR